MPVTGVVSMLFRCSVLWGKCKLRVVTKLHNGRHQ